MAPSSVPCITLDETTFSDDNSSSSEDVIDEVPEEFICPITLCVMKDPVMSKDGKNYDRAAILQWIAKGHQSCPLTRQPLTLSSLVPNNSLRKSIQQWKEEQGLTIKNTNQCQQPCRSLASLGLAVEFRDEMLQQEVPLRQQTQQQEYASSLGPEILNLVALFDEVIEISEDTSTPTNHDIRNTADLDGLVDAEFQYIKEMYDEMVEIGHITPRI
ncbi:U-box domain containing protein [Nitzschia inconspicua]|uniref:U-box domain containing protein n=1 Tax=Nitzschia inconspicua TaxID=303405 RepID=A0A9K3L2U7_9STRA|nr:U-box domain containing protein [Nitzschia inconspicua]